MTRLNIFDSAYDGTPPWDIGRAQDAFVQLERDGRIRGRVLDAGCGTGDLAIFLAQKGYGVTGVDVSTKAIERAVEKARVANVTVDFVSGDALGVEALKRTFDTVVDCGLFHTFTDDARDAYLSALEAVVSPGATLHVLCFSDGEPDWGGPRRIRRQELELAFSASWRVESITPTRFANRITEQGALAWLGSFSYVGDLPRGLH